MSSVEKDHHRGFRERCQRSWQLRKGTFLMRYYIVILLLLSQSCNAEMRISHSVLDGLLNVDFPAGFSRMSEHRLRIKYPGPRRPTEVYSNANGSVSFAFNYTQNAIHPSQIHATHTAMSAFFRRRFPDAQWYRDSVNEQFGTTVFVMEMITPAVDTDIHNIMYGIPLGGRLLLVSFNATVSERNQWLDAGKRALESMQLNASRVEP